MSREIFQVDQKYTFCDTNQKIFLLLRFHKNIIFCATLFAYKMMDQHKLFQIT